MSLPQLIGLTCVRCRKGIASLLDAAFCNECGNPIHHKCAATSPEPADDRCTRCGGAPDSDIAKEVRHERTAHAQAATSTSSAPASPVNATSGRQKARLPEPVTTGSFPVSEKCPKCGSVQFTRVPPQNFIAFAKDRVCNQCGTRYTPPTPLWASVVFILLGGAIMGGSILNFALGANPAPFASIFGIVLGAAALGVGIRGFMKPGKV